MQNNWKGIKEGQFYWFALLFNGIKVCLFHLHTKISLRTLICKLIVNCCRLFIDCISFH